MVHSEQHIPRYIYTLANDLDAVLAATEDFLTLRTDAHPGARLRIELIAITHVLQARQRIRELHFTDPRLTDQSDLFLAGTAVFEINELKKTEPSSGLTSNATMIGGRIPSALLAELASSMLDALEYCFPLYEIGDSEEVIIRTTVVPTSELAVNLTEAA